MSFDAKRAPFFLFQLCLTFLRSSLLLGTVGAALHRRRRRRRGAQVRGRRGRRGGGGQEGREDLAPEKLDALPGRWHDVHELARFSPGAAEAAAEERRWRRRRGGRGQVTRKGTDGGDQPADKQADGKAQGRANLSETQRNLLVDFRALVCSF